MAHIWQKLITFGFHLLYNQLAWTYDIVSWSVSLGHWRKWQTAALDHIHGPHVLEIAHGPGHMLPQLHQRGFQVTACDLSPAMSRIAHGRLRRAHLHHQIPLFRCRIPDLPLAPHSCDSVLSQFPTTYITEQETLNNIYALLRPNGRLVILPEGHLTSQGLLYKFITWLFIITGQTGKTAAAPPKKNAQPAHTPTPQLGIWQILSSRLQTAGFSHITLETIRLKGSEATLIIAEKRSTT